MKPYRIDADLEKSKCICGYPKFICGYPYETANAESAWLALVCMRENSHVQSSVPASSSQAPPPSPASSPSSPPPPLAPRKLLRKTELHTGTFFQLLCLATLLACPCLFVCLFLLLMFLKPFLSGHIACVHFLFFFL